MIDMDFLLEFIFENVKKIFFLEEWIDFDLNFSKSEILALLLIYKKEEITMTELADYIHSPLSTATGIADRLVKGGHIIRDRSDTDRRIVVLKLTQEGIQLIEKLKKVISGYLTLIVQDITHEEMQILVGLIMKIMRNLEKRTVGEVTDAVITGDQLKNIDID